jgi:hypothetical protein
MRQSFSLGRIAGIRVGVNWSVLVIVALLAYGLAAGQFPAEVPRRPEAEYVVAAVVTAVAYMGSLLDQHHSRAAHGRHRRAEPGSLPDGPRGDLLRPHHARVIPRLVALVSDVVEHHIHRLTDDDLAFNPGHAVPRSGSAPIRSDRERDM